MLTGFDSKWLNTLYLDKKIEYENIIQAFSRTNRLFGPDKPFGTIRYYRYPHTMEQNIEKAVKLYSGEKPFGLFVEHLPHNLEKINDLFKEINDLFKNAKIENFEKLPDEVNEKAQFAKLFQKLNDFLEAAKIQGFKWEKLQYEFQNEPDKQKIIDVLLNETTYKIFALRYKELQKKRSEPDINDPDLPYDIDTHLMEIDTDVIDADYMNSRFKKYLKVIEQPNVDKAEQESTLNELHKSFAMLSQEEQKFANIFLHDVQRGSIVLEKGKSFRDYITEYIATAKNDQISKVARALGLDATQLRNIMESDVSETNLNEFGRFDELIKSVDKAKAKKYFEVIEKTEIPLSKINIRVHKLLRDFILNGGTDITEA